MVRADSTKFDLLRILPFCLALIHLLLVIRLNFIVALDMSTAFDIVWLTVLLSKPPCYLSCSSLHAFISSFFSNLSVSAVMNAHCSTSIIYYPSVIFSVETTFLIPSDADGFTLHYSTSKRQTSQDLYNSS